MPCYHPQIAYRSKEGRNANGSWPIVFNVKDGYIDLEVKIPCGKCIGCRLEHSRKWAIRCVHEAQMHTKNCFLTLTYNDENLPEDGSLNKRDIVLFLKKLRDKYGPNIRFFQAGEYGEVCKTCGLHRTKCNCEKYIPTIGRPHHHVLLFNHSFDDMVIHSRKKGIPLYTSESLQKLWKKGFSTIGEVTFESAAYTARYCLKKFIGDKLINIIRERCLSTRQCQENRESEEHGLKNI